MTLLKERWIRAALCAAKYQQALRCYHQHHVRPRSLAVGDLMLRRKLSQVRMNKLPPTWEGPYRVIEVCQPRYVRLAMESGKELPFP